MKISKIEKHGHLRNWNGQVAMFIKTQISLYFSLLIILNGENFFSKYQKVEKSNDYNWFFHPLSQFSDLSQNLQVLQIMTGQKQAFIGFPLNLICLNIMKKTKNSFLKKCSVTLYSGQLCMFMAT